MSELDLDAIEGRADAATAGPWARAVAFRLVAPTKIDGYAFPQDREDAKRKIDANAEFITHARTDVPALVARVRELEAVVERVEALVTELPASRFKSVGADFFVSIEAGELGAALAGGTA